MTIASAISGTVVLAVVIAGLVILSRSVHACVRGKRRNNGKIRSLDTVSMRCCCCCCSCFYCRLGSDPRNRTQHWVSIQETNVYQGTSNTREVHSDLEITTRTPVRSHDSEAFLLNIDSGEKIVAQSFEDTFVRF